MIFTFACVDRTQYDDTALLKAAYKGHTATVSELARLGADLNARSKVRRVGHFACSAVSVVGRALE